MASADLHRVSTQVVCLADDVDERVDVSDRRRHERLRPSALSWLRGARLKYGAEVRILDLSAGGILLEAPSSLTPDSNIVVELMGAGNPIAIPSRVLRCRVASLGEILRYQGACAFKRPLAIPELARRGKDPASALVERAIRETAPSPSTWQKVIARYQDGRVLAGYTSDFHPSKAQFHISPDPRQGGALLIMVPQLKALFFVREFCGDPTHVECKAFVEPPQGRKVEVIFNDNEVLVGSTLGHRGSGHGFFVQPADSRSNNLRVFVTASGARQIRFL
jgi:hypothetical protein